MRCQSAPKTAALMAAQTSSGLTVAEWAQTAASQPAVNAHHVEAVQAWECPQEFALGESVHTDSARVRCALLQAERCHHGSVNEDPSNPKLGLLLELESSLLWPSDRGAGGVASLQRKDL
eukprot:CAMPEP_0171116840 /NCGR_PEP_ID=MMETSP0766_2-20121228/91163_1 /TAXON_ID=439317 /ORGANISM="Gambierdiscus australes, Strain CAWD 149" /LENGTH=119 /DNA_ID=CAMNT_0011579309 /DNA_START=122 /DNA_END=478 /DNA_ORIENTATION=-